MATSEGTPFASKLKAFMVTRSIRTISLPFFTGTVTGQTEAPNFSCSCPKTLSKSASGSSNLLMKKVQGTPASAALSQASSVPTSTPDLASTRITAFSLTLRACLTSATKSR